MWLLAAFLVWVSTAKIAGHSLPFLCSIAFNKSLNFVRGSFRALLIVPIVIDEYVPTKYGRVRQRPKMPNVAVKADRIVCPLVGTLHSATEQQLWGNHCYQRFKHHGVLCLTRRSL